ncbi:hypothetical protein FJZ31_20840 [Candidatus Poribacteria bacterium]|nr:hypothetical protein [Candidatus Poribacteria bacterium]
MGKKNTVLFIVIVTILSVTLGYYLGDAKTQKELVETQQNIRIIEAKLGSRISILEAEVREYQTLFKNKQEMTTKETANLRSQGLLLKGKSEILKAMASIMEQNFNTARLELEKAIQSFEDAARISLQQDVIFKGAIDELIYDAKVAKEALSSKSTKSATLKDYLEILSKKLDAVCSSMERSAWR